MLSQSRHLLMLTLESSISEGLGQLDTDSCLLKVNGAVQTWTASAKWQSVPAGKDRPVSFTEEKALADEEEEQRAQTYDHDATLVLLKDGRESRYGFVSLPGSEQMLHLDSKDEVEADQRVSASRWKHPDCPLSQFSPIVDTKTTDGRPYSKAP